MLALIVQAAAETVTAVPVETIVGAAAGTPVGAGITALLMWRRLDAAETGLSRIQETLVEMRVELGTLSRSVADLRADAGMVAR